MRKPDLRNAIDAIQSVFVFSISMFHLILNLVWIKLILFSEITWIQLFDFLGLSTEAFFWILVGVVLFDFMGVIFGAMAFHGRDKKLDANS